MDCENATAGECEDCLRGKAREAAGTRFSAQQTFVVSYTLDSGPVSVLRPESKLCLRQARASPSICSCECAVRCRRWYDSYAWAVMGLLKHVLEVVSLRAAARAIVIYLDVVAPRRKNPNSYVLVGVPELCRVAYYRQVGGIITQD